MNHSKSLLVLLGGVLSLQAARADLLNGLVAYYNFEETGTPGLANKAPGASSFNATRVGTLQTDWATGANATGPGFTGNAAFTDISGTSDRSQLKVGKALNLDDDRDETVQIPLGTAQLGSSFSISAWHILSPGASNTSNRYHAFESTTNYDVSWGTANTTSTTVQVQYPYLAYLGELPAGGFGPASVTTGEWHHVVHSFSSDGTTTTLTIYFDGVLVGSRTAATSTIDFPALALGRHRSVAGDRDWDGMMDEVAIWNRALTANDATELYRRGQENIALTTDLATVNKAFISVSPSDPGGGAVYGTDLYTIGQQANIEAMEGLGYVFSGWTGAFAGKPQSYTFTVTASASGVATLNRDLADDDNDGLSNYDELVTYGTVPDDPDTDADGLKDGDEVNSTHTDPVVSQKTAVDYILANLAGGGSNPGDIVLTRNSSTNTVSFLLTPRQSTTLASWTPITPQTSGVSLAASGSALQLGIPGTADTKRFFSFQGSTP